jgi:foldase protein PrsA
MRTARLIPALCALLALSVLVAACGGVPGNAVATVDGNAIDKAQFDHWLNVAAKSSGQPNAVVPDPPDFTKCVAQKRKAAAKPAKGQPKQTDAQLKTQCRQEYNAERDQVLQLLISFQWIQGEAQDMGVKVSDQEVMKSFQQQKKQAYPKEAQYQKFLKQSGQTQADILQRVKLDLLSNKIRDKVLKGKDKVTPAQIQKYYDANKAQFSQPERRDLRVVLTKTKPKAEQALSALKGGQSWSAVAKRYSIDTTSKAQGGKLPAQAKGTLDKQLDDAVFSAAKGKLLGPIKTQFGYYVFEVTGVTDATQQSLKQATPTIKQTLANQNQQKALNRFISDFRKRWRAKTECQDGFKTSDCSNGPKPTPTPSAAGVPTTPQG